MKNNSRKNKFSLLLLIGMIIIYLVFFRKDKEAKHVNQDQTIDRRSVDHREKKFRHNKIYYTVHANCRMKCRNIDSSEVKEILADGKINYTKSDLHGKGCPKYALEGITHDQQHVRVIVGDCESQASIITVIDLDTDFECDCN
jgi:hypothetical protein